MNPDIKGIGMSVTHIYATYFENKLGYRNTLQQPSRIKVTSKNVIPAKAGIQKFSTSLNYRFCGSDELIIIRGSLKN
jgi:hypothetical protein